MRDKTGISGALDAAEPGRVSRRRARTRQALMHAAETLSATQSVDAVSVDDIAALADVAKGTFYNYFNDKDTLARELTEMTRLELEASIANRNDGIEDPRSASLVRSAASSASVSIIPIGRGR